MVGIVCKDTTKYLNRNKISLFFGFSGQIIYLKTAGSYMPPAVFFI